MAAWCHCDRSPLQVAPSGGGRNCTPFTQRLHFSLVVCVTDGVLPPEKLLQLGSATLNRRCTSSLPSTHELSAI